MRPNLLASALVVATFAGQAAAEPRAEDLTLYITGGEPFAEVVGGRIRLPKCGPRKSAREGNRVGDVWSRLDGWGRP